MLLMFFAFFVSLCVYVYTDKKTLLKKYHNYTTTHTTITIVRHFTQLYIDSEKPCVYNTFSDRIVYSCTQ